MKLTDAIKKLFKHKHTTPLPTGEGQGERLPLRIEGVKPAPLTPEPDDAELAAQALLESLSPDPSPVERWEAKGADLPLQGGQRGASYYRRLAERIRLARDQATLRTMRFVTWCEYELEKRDLPIEDKGSLALMEAELYKRIDTIERVGGELKHRWQHCLANVLVRQMAEERKNEELSESPTDPNTTTN